MTTTNILNHNDRARIRLDRIRSERLGRELEAQGCVGETIPRTPVQTYWTTMGTNFSARGGEVKITHFQVTVEDLCL
jgi:hypothetical protein